jgi:hypothetical protein
MIGDDPVAVYAEVEAFRDARFDTIADPELSAILADGNRKLIALLRRVFDQLQDGDPGMRARRIAEAEFIQQTHSSRRGAIRPRVSGSPIPVPTLR